MTGGIHYQDRMQKSTTLLLTDNAGTGCFFFIRSTGILANFPLPVASQRNIKVIAQPAGKRNMPPPPKFRNGSGEVAINLQGIAINTHQILHPRIKSRIIKNTLYKVNADIVRYNRFLEEPTHDEEDSTSEHLIGDKQRAADLRNEITGTYNRTRHQLGKERNIKSIIQQTGQRRYLATVHIYRIAQRLKSEKEALRSQGIASRAIKRAMKSHRPSPVQAGRNKCHYFYNRSNRKNKVTTANAPSSGVATTDKPI